MKEAVLEGRRPSRPTLMDCSELVDEIWELIVMCWAHEVQSRPSMTYVAIHVSDRLLQLSSTE